MDIHRSEKHFTVGMITIVAIVAILFCVFGLKHPHDIAPMPMEPIFWQFSL